MGNSVDSIQTERTERPVQVNCDEEAWMIRRLKTLCRSVMALNSCKLVSADDTIIENAISGAIHGTALELCNILGLKPELVNIKKGEFAHETNNRGAPTPLNSTQRIK